MTDYSQLKKKREAKQKPYNGIKTYHDQADFRPELKGDNLEGTHPQLGPLPHEVNGLYASLPKSQEIRVNKGEGGNGRGIYSLCHRKPGDILMSLKPHIAALSNDNLEGYCSNCFGAGSNSLRRCTGCKVVHYCDAACQTADWQMHKQECIAIQRWSSSSDSGSLKIPGDAIRCLGRMLWRKKKLGRESIWAKELDAMESHRTSLSKDPTSRDSQVYTQLAHAIVRFLGLNSAQELADFGMDSAGDLVDLVSRFTTNTFTISKPALAPLGACVSPLVALINHSCDPNAVVVFPRAGAKDQEPLMQVIALKPISPNDEILTSYVDTSLPSEARQKVLRETYHFRCRCGQCAPDDNSQVDLRQVMWCPRKCGGFCPLPTEENSLTRCSECKVPVKDTDAVLDAIRVGQEALDKAEALQFSNPPKSIQLTTKLIPILVSAGLVPAAHPLLALARLNSSLLIAHLPSADANVEEIRSPAVQASHPQPSQKVTPEEAQEALDEAIRVATRASTGLSQVLTEGHPVRGVALAELGKLLSVDEPCPANTPELESSSGGNPSTPTPSSVPLGLNMKSATYPPSGPQRLKLAYQTLVRARQELEIGFGGGKHEGGEVGRSVRDLAASLEKELSVWRTGVKNALEDAMLAKGTKK